MLVLDNRPVGLRFWDRRFAADLRLRQVDQFSGRIGRVGRVGRVPGLVDTPNCEHRQNKKHQPCYIFNAGILRSNIIVKKKKSFEVGFFVFYFLFFEIVTTNPTTQTIFFSKLLNTLCMSNCQPTKLHEIQS